VKGTQLGSYLVMGKLASGGMATVYVASHTRLGHVVALKILHPHFQQDENVRSRFVDEARIQANMRHANILTVQDILELPEASCLVMELLSGCTLSTYYGAAGLPLPVPRVVGIFSSLAGALHHAHMQRVIHRDLKPSNVYLLCTGGDAVPKLMDFGIAKLSHSVQAKMTATGTILGTPHYMAPEQFEDSSAVDGRADIFSLGVMMYEACTGQLPFEGTTVTQLMKVILTQEPKRPAELRPDCPPEMEALILRCLAKDRDRRFESAVALQAALDEIGGKVGCERIPSSLVPRNIPEDRELDMSTLLTQTGSVTQTATDGRPPTVLVPPISEHGVDASWARLSLPRSVDASDPLPGYRITRKIYDGTETFVYRGIQTSKRTPVVIKVPAADYPQPSVLARLKHEFKLASSLDIEGVIKVLALEKFGNGLALVVEDFGGGPLKELLAEGPMDLEEFLDLALRITHILGQLHARDVIHKDINPKNVLVNRATGAVKIIDFGLASQVSGQVEDLGAPTDLVGTLAYISPEQTGRMNRPVDYRSDFYSLGVTFYEMLTGQQPFRTSDRAELVHCHLARRPPQPSDIDDRIPKALSDIVMRLVAKTAEERYQSAAGLAADLTSCLEQLRTSGQIVEFTLAAHDISDRFQVSQRLYGREEQVGRLLDAFGRASQGYKEMLLVAGFAGIGKTSLVRELYRPVTERRAFFISGKFDQYKRDIPYGALIDAFQGLVRELLGGEEEVLSRWRDDLLRVLGPNGQVLIDVIPEIELLIGRQPSVPPLPPAESYNRLNLAFNNFVSVFTTKEHPLVIFLDDLQWADNASLNLVRMLMTGAESQYLLVIGAYRDNEVDAAHPLSVTLEEIRGAGTVVHELILLPLALPQICQLLADTLKSTPDKVLPLAELIQIKTSGNPFFMSEFLKSLHAHRLVQFKRESESWSWDLPGIQALGVTENVVDLMAAKIRKMKPATQQALKLAAIIGNQFDLQTLALASSKSAGEILGALKEAVIEGLILLIGEAYKYVEFEKQELADGLLDAVLLHTVKYRFAHDKIQQAAYSLVAADAARRVHRQVGTILLANTPPEKLEQRIFDIVNQFNASLELIDNTPDADEAVRLNLIAGRRARASAAYQSALHYFEVGIGLLRDDPWNRSYDVALGLYSEAAEAARLCNRRDEMDSHVQQVLDHATSLGDQIPVFEVRIHGYIAQARKIEALGTGLDVLERLGVRVTRRPNNVNVGIQLLRTVVSLVGKSPEMLLEHHAMTRENLLTAMRISTSLSSTAYVVYPNLFPVLVCKQVELSARHGNASTSPFAYALYGTILCGVLHRIELGYRFGRLAMDLQERLPDSQPLAPRCTFTYAATVQHFREPLVDTFANLRGAYKQSLEQGDFEFAAANAGVLIYHLFYSGQNLLEVEPDVANFVDVIEQLKQEAYLNYARLYLEAIRELMTPGQGTPSVSGGLFDADAVLPLLQERSDMHGIFNVWLVRGVLAFLFGNSQRAVECLDQARTHVFSVTGMFTSLAFCFYDALARIAACAEASPEQRRRHLRLVAVDQKRIGRWARHCPSSHLHKWHLVEAELARLRGDVTTAMQSYDQAVDLARKSGFMQEEALANELAARFYLSLGKVRIARTFMTDALYTYDKWGSGAKVAHIETAHPDLVMRVAIAAPDFSESASSHSSTHSASTSTGRSGLDLIAVLKASQVISGEIRLASLLERMMAIVVENAGAQRGLLFLESDGKLYVEAESAPDSPGVEVLQHLPMRELDNAAQAVLNYVMRLQEPVVLADAANESSFSKDSYITSSRPRSILCLPLIRQGKLTGLLYLENNLASGAFTPSRVEVLKMLASEIVISLENARLYRRLEEHNAMLERKVRERTQELKDANELLAQESRKSESLLLNVLPSKIAAQLKESGKAAPESFDNVTVYFSDIVNFTERSTRLEPTVLIDELNDLFTEFDNIVSRHGCERIKTIGDAYMCVGGMPEEQPDHADRILRVAADVLRYMEERNRKSSIQWQVRVGVHSGRVVGGVVGVKKYIYDVFGDTINTAARMEQMSEPMRVNVSQATVSLVQDRFQFEERPAVEVKGKGTMRMYYLRIPGP